MMTLAIQPAEAGENSLDPLFNRHSGPGVRRSTAYPGAHWR